MAVVAVFVVADLSHDRANTIVTIITPAFAVIAGLVGAYLGLRAGTLAARQVTEAVQQQAGGHLPSPNAPRDHGAQPDSSPEPTAGELTRVWLEARHRRRARLKRAKRSGRR